MRFPHLIENELEEDSRIFVACCRAADIMNHERTLLDDLGESETDMHQPQKAAAPIIRRLCLLESFQASTAAHWAPVGQG